MKITKYHTAILLLLLCVLFESGVIPAFAINKNEDVVELQKHNNLPFVASINFDYVLKKAKEHSYDLKIADYNVLISKQGIREARSEYFPKLNLGAGMEYTKNYRDVQESTIMSIGDAFINPYTRFQSVLGITVGYNLFDFGVRGGNLKIAKEDVKLKELENKQKLQELNLTLLDSYTKILLTTRQIEKNNKILNIEKQNLEIKKRLYKAKEISKTDLNDEEIKVQNIKNKIIELNSIRAEALNWLTFYTGEEYDRSNLIVEDFKTSKFDVSAFKDYTKSIIWQIHEKNIKKKELEVKVVRRVNYPKVNVYGRYYLYGSDRNNIGKSMDIEPSNFSVGASINVPIFDGFKNSANIQKTELELKQLYVERDKAIAQYMARLASMRSNLIFLDEQINGNNKSINELVDKEKSMHRLVAKKIISPSDENDTKIELLNQRIEFDKNNITHTAITKGIEILTEEL